MAKKFEELQLKDNFMFCAVMMDPANCKELLETILEIPIDRVTVEKEKTIVYNPEYKGVRLDVYAKDENNTHYNVEMQVEYTPVEKRSRYYHSMIDSDLLLTGAGHEKLPDSYIIFICDYKLFRDNPFGNKYRYTLQYSCREYPEMPYDDGNYTILLSTSGDNPADISPKLQEFLNYVKDHRTAEGGKTGYAVRLDESIRRIKQDREVRSRYMLYEEMMKKEHDAGYAEGHEDGLAEGFDKGRREEKANTERERKRAEEAEAKAKAAESEIARLKTLLSKYQE